MTMQYKAPNGTPSSIGGNQMNTFLYQKAALYEAREKQFFSQLASVKYMPKHYGKEIRVYEYVPLLDDENINDQGIDAAGATLDSTKYYVSLRNSSDQFTVEADATAAAAAVNAIEAGVAVKTGSGSPWTVTYSKTKLIGTTLVLATAVSAAVPRSMVQQGSGNLYGSSKDTGSITSKLPVLSENGGRVNRVGFKRKELQGTMQMFGFFHEWTRESIDFDSDADLEKHLERELVNGAVEMSEDMLQVDLLNAAGLVRYPGAATSVATLNTGDVVTYSDLMHLSIDLDNNLAEKRMDVITGTRMIDTRTIPSCRVMYIGSELLPTLKAMKDLHNNPAFIEVHKYQGGTTVLRGEVGAVDNFRIIVVPKMLKWANAGAKAVDDTYYQGDTNYDVFPMLVVTSDTFTTIGFQTDGKSAKWKTLTKKPGIETAHAHSDPYGQKGFSSIQWYYGFLCYRPERIGLIKTLAKL